MNKSKSQMNRDRYTQLRYFKDHIFTFCIRLGGWTVLSSLLLIFFYLIYEVMPLTYQAKSELLTSYSSPSQYPALFLNLEEQDEIAMRIGSDGQAIFFSADSGRILSTQNLKPKKDESISIVATSSEASRLLALGTSNGRVLFVKHDYQFTYAENSRVITPRITFPYGKTPFDLAQGALTGVAVNENDSAILIAGLVDGALYLKAFRKEIDPLFGNVTLDEIDINFPVVDLAAQYVVFDQSQRWLFVMGKEDISVINLSEVMNGHVIIHSKEKLKGLRTMTKLLGGLSILIGFDDGTIEQRFMVSDQNNWHFKKIREFKSDSNEPIVGIVPEQRRKGFVSLSANGELNIFHSTSERHLLSQSIGNIKPMAWGLSPRASNLITEASDGKIYLLSLTNGHPEVSWKSLWDKVWYESYSEPKYIWQSSASDVDFEPKFSLAPLAYGTIKAALYSMLLAAPLAICAAIYTAFFMSKSMRNKIKPVIELMEALPTVVIGFLAGLWLAPFVENHLTSIFLIMLVTPISIVFLSYPLMKWAPLKNGAFFQGKIPLLLIPLMIFIGWICVESGQHVELMFFNGDMRTWLVKEMGISYDQRNALVVGIAIGFAVIPTIYSISEDALFAIPKSLRNAAFALGATPWHTLTNIILPAASPGIFSALMVGFGRAVGETMIVLMATGNTPIMNANIFEGMRTLAANIAIEITETPVDSTHFRVLFLTAVVLFMFTFVVNSVAEMIRQRLRKRYGAL